MDCTLKGIKKKTNVLDRIPNNTIASIAKRKIDFLKDMWLPAKEECFYAYK